MPMLRYLLGLATLLVLLSACGKRSAAVGDSELPPKRAAEQLLAEINRSLYVPTIAELKGDIDVASPDLNIKLAATIRMQTDSAFWFSMRKFGFEGARGLVTRDSVVLLNRLQREVLQASSNDLPEEAKVLPIAPTLANLLAAFGGQPIGDWRGAAVERTAGRYLMQLPNARGTLLEVQAGPTTVPTRWSYTDGQQFGEVVFADFRTVQPGKVFPFYRSLRFSDTPGDTTRVELSLESLTAHESLDFPISIPASYSPMEL